MAEHKKKHHKFSHTHTEWHKDGSATVHHQHEDGPDKDVKHAAADLDGVHDSLEDHMGSPNEGEAEVSQAPAPAAPAGIPGGAPAAPGM